MIVIDGEQFKIDVLSVKAQRGIFLDKYAGASPTHLRRERLIGVYFNYKLQFGPGLDRKGPRPTVEDKADRTNEFRGYSAR